MTITLYTTHCQNCKALENKLKEKGIEYEEVTDMEVMLSKKIRSAPVLEVDEKLMTFSQAINWVKERG